VQVRHAAWGQREAGVPPRSADLLLQDEAAQASVAGTADGLGSGRRALAAVRALFQLVQGGDVLVRAWPVARGTPKSMCTSDMQGCALISNHRCCAICMRQSVSSGPCKISLEVMFLESA